MIVALYGLNNAIPEEGNCFHSTFATKVKEPSVFKKHLANLFINIIHFSCKDKKKNYTLIITSHNIFVPVITYTDLQNAKLIINRRLLGKIKN